MLGDTLELGLGLLDGVGDGEDEGLTLADGDTDADGLTEALGEVAVSPS